MIIEKGKVYGYSYEELQAMGKSYKDVWGDIEVDNKDLELSVWDIIKMFRNQYLIIRVTQCEDRDQIYCFDYGCVYFYNCNEDTLYGKVEELNKKYNTEDFISYSIFDPRWAGDTLWF